jgi:23S rRNA (uracil1939-C5)-methyltransferase
MVIIFNMSSSEIVVKLTTAIYGGDCMGRLPDGRAVFVPLAIPGETARIRLVEEKRGHVRAELLEILEPSPARQQAPCRHFGRCGGCHYQHIPYEEQLAIKTAILCEQLERIGGLVSPPVEPCVPSPKAFHYRNHSQFHLTPEGKLGLFQKEAKEVFAVEECLLPEEPLNDIWPLLDFEAMPEIERIGLRLGMGEEVQLILESEDLVAPEILIEDLPISVAHLSPAGSLVLAGSPFVFIEIAGRAFRVSAGSFFQVNTAMAAAMIEHVLANLKLTQNMIALDVYCGVGLFSAFLAPRLGRLIGIESSQSACEDFVVNLDEFETVELYEATAEQVLSRLEVKPDLILVDPPRAGLDRRALDGILALGAPQLVYISCDPATLARDARRLIQGGFQLKKITPFDVFPQTYHIESISFWEQ